MSAHCSACEDGRHNECSTFDDEPGPHCCCCLDDCPSFHDPLMDITGGIAP